MRYQRQRQMPILLKLPFPPIYWCPNPCRRSSIYLVQNFFFLAKRQRSLEAIWLYLMHLIKYWYSPHIVLTSEGLPICVSELKSLSFPFLESRFWEWIRQIAGVKLPFGWWGWGGASCSLQWTQNLSCPRADYLNTKYPRTQTFWICLNSETLDLPLKN